MRCGTENPTIYGSHRLVAEVKCICGSLKVENDEEYTEHFWYTDILCRKHGWAAWKYTSMDHKQLLLKPPFCLSIVKQLESQDGYGQSQIFDYAMPGKIVEAGSN